MISAYYYMFVCHILEACCMHMTQNWDLNYEICEYCIYFSLSNVISLFIFCIIMSYDIYFQRVGDRHTNKENLSSICNINKA
jgi:hypothetical protein